MYLLHVDLVNHLYQKFKTWCIVSFEFCLHDAESRTVRRPGCLSRCPSGSWRYTSRTNSTTPSLDGFLGTTAVKLSRRRWCCRRTSGNTRASLLSQPPQLSELTSMPTWMTFTFSIVAIKLKLSFFVSYWCPQGCTWCSLQHANRGCHVIQTKICCFANCERSLCATSSILDRKPDRMVRHLPRPEAECACKCPQHKVVRLYSQIHHSRSTTTLEGELRRFAYCQEYTLGVSPWCTPFFLETLPVDDHLLLCIMRC